MAETKCKRGFQSHVMCDCEPTHPLTPREKVEKIIRANVRSHGRGGTLLFTGVENCAERILTALASGAGDQAELARLAEAATRGPWVSERSVDEWGVSVIASNETGHISNPTRGQVCHVSVVAGASGDDPDLAQANAAFIAAANPATVLSLLAEIAALRGERDEWRDTAFKARSSNTRAERKLAEAVELLKPFSESAENLADETLDHDHIWEQPAAMIINAGHLRAARTFLSKEAERG